MLRKCNLTFVIILSNKTCFKCTSLLKKNQTLSSFSDSTQQILKTDGLRQEVDYYCHLFMISNVLKQITLIIYHFDVRLDFIKSFLLSGSSDHFINCWHFLRNIPIIILIIIIILYISTFDYKIYIYTM